jgi:hypothetical protein
VALVGGSEALEMQGAEFLMGVALVILGFILASLWDYVTMRMGSKRWLADLSRLANRGGRGLEGPGLG